MLANLGKQADAHPYHIVMWLATTEAESASAALQVPLRLEAALLVTEKCRQANERSSDWCRWGT